MYFQIIVCPCFDAHMYTEVVYVHIFTSIRANLIKAY